MNKTKRLCCLIAASLFLSCSFTKGADAASVTSANHGSEPYSLSYNAGGTDSNGNFLGGTEFMNLVAFQGRLYGGLSYWKDDPNYFPKHPDPASGPQVLVLNSKNSQWQQEVVFNQYVGGRINTMEEIKFHSFDASGKVVGTIADMLVAAATGSRNGDIFTQRSPGVWEDTHFPGSSVRSLAVHYDSASKIEKVFAGCTGSNSAHAQVVYSGIYNPKVSGRIQWNSTPESLGQYGRVMSMVDCEGSLFAAARPSVLKRNDQTQSWQPIYTYHASDSFDQSQYPSGFRGLTVTHGPGGTPVILSGYNGYYGDILEIDPQSGAGTTEIRLRDSLGQQWGSPPLGKGIIAGYNNIPLIAQGVRMFGLLCLSPNLSEASSAWTLSRSIAGSGGPSSTGGGGSLYMLHQVKALSFPYQISDRQLYSVRTLIVSPFLEDQGQVLYVAGYDAHFQTEHNTAWCYRVGINTAMQPYIGAGSASN